MPPNEKRQKRSLRPPLQKARRLYTLLHPKEFNSPAEWERFLDVRSHGQLVDKMRKGFEKSGGVRLVKLVRREKTPESDWVRAGLVVYRKSRGGKSYAVKVTPFGKANIVINSMLRRADFVRLPSWMKDLFAKSILVKEAFLVERKLREKEAQRKGIPMNQTRKPAVSPQVVRKSLAKEYSELARDVPGMIKVKGKKSAGRGKRPDDLRDEELREVTFYRNEIKAMERAIQILRNKSVWKAVLRELEKQDTLYR